MQSFLTKEPSLARTRDGRGTGIGGTREAVAWTTRGTTISIPNGTCPSRPTRPPWRVGDAPAQRTSVPGPLPLPLPLALPLRQAAVTKVEGAEANHEAAVAGMQGASVASPLPLPLRHTARTHHEAAIAAMQGAVL